MDSLFFLIIILLLYLFFKERNKVSYNKPKKFKSPYIKEVVPEKRNYEDIHNKERNPYSKKKYLLTLAEKNFFEVLKLSIQDTNYYICPKVRMADIVYVHEKYNYTAYFNKIKSKHIDFVLCDITSMSPLIAIELDDSSHLDLDRIERDTFFNLTLTECGITVIRFDVKKSYNVNHIKEKLNISSVAPDSD